jgi:hypothetical protein
VTRVNERSVRIRKLNDAGTCMSDEYVTLKFKREAELKDAHRLEGHPPCWCVTDIHALTPEVAQEKYFHDKLLECNPYIAKKIGWTERMRAAEKLDLQRGAERKSTADKVDALVENVQERVFKQKQCDRSVNHQLRQADLIVCKLVHLKHDNGYEFACFVRTISTRYVIFCSVERDTLGKELRLSSAELATAGGWTITQLRPCHSTYRSPIDVEVRNIMLSDNASELLPCHVCTRIMAAAAQEPKQSQPVIPAFVKPNVTDLINAGKYRDMRADQLEAQLRADLEDSYVRPVPGGTPVKKLDALWACVWKHAHVDTNGLHDVVYWYDELWPLVAP